jgi:hypothetical protein
LQVIEDVGTFSVTVVRTGGATGNLSVNYSTSDGTAIAGQDYTSASGTLTFTGGETSKTIQIPIADDATTETDETFTISLSTANLETLGAHSTVVVTIQDHNTTPVIFVDGVSIPEGNTGTTTDAVFTVRLSAATGRAVSFNFATGNLGGALGGSQCGNPGVDYETASGSLAFSPAVSSFAIPVKVCGDNHGEANEIFRIALSNVSGAALQVNQGFGTILESLVQVRIRLQLLIRCWEFGIRSVFKAFRTGFRLGPIGIREWHSSCGVYNWIQASRRRSLASS